MRKKYPDPTQGSNPDASGGGSKKKFKTQTFLVVKPKDGSKPKVYQEISDFDGYEIPVSPTDTDPVAAAAPQQQQHQSPAPQRPTAQPPPLPAPRNEPAKPAKKAVPAPPPPPMPRREASPARPKTPDDIYSEIPFIDEDGEEYVAVRTNPNDKSPS